MAVGQGIDGDVDRLAHRQRREVKFRHGEIDLEDIDLLQVDDIGAGADIGAGTDLPQPDDALEGGANDGFIQLRLGDGDAGLVHPHVGQRLIARLGRADALLEQLGGALEIGLPEVEAGARLGQLGAHDRVVQGHQYGALGDRGAFVEVGCGDEAGHFGADHHAFDRAQGTDRGNIADHGIDPHLGGLDRDGEATRSTPPAWPGAGPEDVIPADSDGDGSDKGTSDPDHGQAPEGTALNGADTSSLPPEI